MAARRPAFERLSLSAARAAVLVAACALAPACASDAPPAGGDGRYTLRTLSASAPGRVPAASVAAAASDALRDMGFTVLRTEVAGDTCRVTARAPGDGPLREVQVRARATHDATELRVRVTPIGDRDRSQAVLDGVLARLAE